MRKVDVTGWEFEGWRGVSLLFTMPTGGGYRLITCLTCGEVFAVSEGAELYRGPPLEQKLVGELCPTCHTGLGGNFADYPRTYVHEGVTSQFFVSEAELTPDRIKTRRFFAVYDE